MQPAEEGAGGAWRPLDEGFTARVRETTLGLGGFTFVALLMCHDLAVPLSFACGLGIALLVWRAAEEVGGSFGRRHWRARDIARLLAIYFGKYAVAGLALWGLVRCGGFSAPGFTGGFVVPTVVVGLKAAGWMFLSPSMDPAPVYSRDRKVGGRG